MTQKSLFGKQPVHPPADQVKPQQPKHRGLYAGEPGTGPKGQTCATCFYITFESQGRRKNVPKCALTKHLWREPEPSEILPTAPACYKWEFREAAV